MQSRQSIAHILEPITGGLPVPLLAKAGAIVIAAGLAFDLLAHTALHAINGVLIGSVPLDEHLAHLTVVIGMTLVLASIVGNGIRSQRRLVRQEGSARHAVR